MKRLFDAIDAMGLKYTVEGPDDSPTVKVETAQGKVVTETFANSNREKQITNFIEFIQSELTA